MKAVLPILSAVILLTSCSTVYKTGQTPDDVYFSPAPPKVEYSKDDEKEESRQEKRQEDEYNAYSEDRYLRMRVRDRARWSRLDDYYRDPYAYTYSGCNCNCDVNPRLYWGYHYSPYGPNVVIVNPNTPVYSKPRTFNLNSYYPANTNTGKSTATGTRRTYTTPVRANTSSNNVGSTLRDIFRSSDSAPAKSSNSSSSSSNSTNNNNSSRSTPTNNGNAPVRRF
jgi:hypothetical protein